MEFNDINQWETFLPRANLRSLIIHGIYVSYKFGQMFIKCSGYS